ncbi:DUF481 domain-containing protein [Rheinheimera sp.]|uniref:DUF481 domain-containing protein n=1 Tax=Rheinheimera sp. TaxID=1869214 RepID=UPI00307E07C1
MCLALSCLTVQATEVHLELDNGDRLSGRLVRYSDSELVLATSYAGELMILRQHIKSSHPELTTVQPDFTDTSAPAATVGSELSQPGDIEHQHRVDLSASSRRNENSLDALGFASSSELRWQQLRANLDSKYDYETSNDAEKVHKYSLTPGLDYFFAEALFWRTKADYGYNYLATDYKNLDLSSGLGYSFVDTDDARAELILLLGFKRSSFRDQALLELLLDGDHSVEMKFSQLEWDLRYRWADTALEWYSEGYLLKHLNQPVRFLYFGGEINASTGVRYHLTDSVRLSYSWVLDWSRIDFRFAGVPDLNLDSRDLSQKISLGARF